MMGKIRQQKLLMEAIWWVFTLIIIVLVMLPIWLNAPAYPFFFENILLIIIFITFTRYIFLLPITFIAKAKWIKVFVILAAFLFFFVLSNALSQFRNFMDEEGLQTIVTDLHVTEQTRIMRYIKNEMLFFGVGSIIAGILLPMRMIVSLWRMRNKGTV